MDTAQAEINTSIQANGNIIMCHLRLRHNSLKIIKYTNFQDEIIFFD
jgi:hypothetical protein